MVPASVKSKLELMCARRSRNYAYQRTHDPFVSWCNLEEFTVQLSSSKMAELIVEDVEGQMRMSFKILHVDNDREEIHTIRREFCDINTGHPCPGFIDDDDYFV